MSLHAFLDWHYGENGDAELLARLMAGENVNEIVGADGETPLHVATRRRCCSAVGILLEHGADINAKNAHGKTCFAHAARRRFDELTTLLAFAGAATEFNDADRFAVAVVNGELDEARAILAEHPGIACTGNPGEDRLLADVAGRSASEPVKLLIEAGANLATPGLDGGTPLHPAAWFGQPANARMLIDAGAPLDDFENAHESSPLGWAVHGSRYSGGADERQAIYEELVRMLLDAGACLHHPGRSDIDDYLQILLSDASPTVRAVLEARAG